MLVAGVELLLVVSSGPGWLALELPVAFGLAFERSAGRSGSGRGVARKRRADHLHQECPSVTSQHVHEEAFTMVLIGVDPHKASHTAVAIDDDERPIAQLRVAADRAQLQRLLAWAKALGDDGRGSSSPRTGSDGC